MAYPVSGILKVYPHNLTILPGSINLWSMNNIASPQPASDVSALDAYFDSRVTSLAVAPTLRKWLEYPPASGVYVPSVADYELSFSSSSVGIKFYDNTFPSAVVATHDFLDPDFPMGMVVYGIQVWWTGETLFGSNRDRAINSIILKYGIETVYTYTPGGAVLLNSSIASPTEAILPSYMRWSVFRMLTNFGFMIPVVNTVSVLTGIPRSTTSECFLTAVYDTQYFNIQNTIQNAGPGGEVRIVGSHLTVLDELFINHYDPDGDPVKMSPPVRVPRHLIIIWTDELIIFRIPKIKYGGTRLFVSASQSSGVSFSGSVLLAQVNIQLVDGSGVYTLVDGKTNDTYYDRSVAPVGTLDLKIPDPYVKTAFFKS